MRCLPILLLVGTASCATVEIQTDRPADVYAMRPSGMEFEGEVEPGQSLSVSRLFSSSAIEVLCVSKAKQMAHAIVPPGERHVFTVWNPASDLLETALSHRIKKGMTQTEVRFAFGSPQSVTDSDDGPVLEYERGSTLYFLFFKGDRLRTWTKHDLIGYYDGWYYW